MNKPCLWIIGGGSLQTYAVNKAHEMGLETIVTDNNRDCECREITDWFYGIDIFDIEGHLELAEALRTRAPEIEIVGVLAAGIDAPETASALDEFFGWGRTASRAVARLCHNKLEMRSAMEWMGYPVPKYFLVDGVWELRRMLSTDFKETPFVVKPLNNSGGRGQTIFGNHFSDSQLEKALLEAQAANKGMEFRVLIEELWRGTEHTVETLWQSGEFHPCFITDRLFGSKDEGKHRIELGLRNPTVLPEWQQAAIFRLAESIGRDLGITNGALKLDLICTPKGPRVIEMTTRLSGGFDAQVLVPAATGQDIVGSAIKVAVGAVISPETKTKDRVAISASMWPTPGKKITKIDDSQARQIPGVEMIKWRYGVGDVIPEYVDSSCRVNFIITSGKDEQEAYAAMTKAMLAVELEVK